MANVVTIHRPEVVALIEEAAKDLTEGNQTEAVALAVRRLGPLWFARRGASRFRASAQRRRPHRADARCPARCRDRPRARVVTERLLLDTHIARSLDSGDERFLAHPGIEAVPLGCRAASRSYDLHPPGHRDPADRLLIVTPIELACSLVSYDDRTARFGKQDGRQYRFAVGA